MSKKGPSVAHPVVSVADADALPKRDAILAAALDLFAERGFHGTAVPLIVEKAGVGAGTLYRYFENKEAIVNAVFQEWKREVGRRLVHEFPMDAPPRQQFHELMVRLAKFARQHPRVLQFLELHHHASYLDAQSRAVEDEMLAPLRMFVAEAQRLQVIKRVDAALLMPMVWGAAIGVIRASWEGRVNLNRAAWDALENCIWEAIRC